jgi:hypothetical protein
MGHKCEFIFCQENKTIVAYQIDTELFFEELLVKKNKQNGLFCSYIWYKIVGLYRNGKIS